MYSVLSVMFCTLLLQQYLAIIYAVTGGKLMSTGTVKWFNNAKGYGFIEPTEGGNDIFVHYSTIGMEGYKSLKAGQEVTFDLSEGPKGVHATDIVPLATKEDDSAE